RLPSTACGPWRHPATTPSTLPASLGSSTPPGTARRPSNGVAARRRATTSWKRAIRRPSLGARPVPGGGPPAFGARVGRLVPASRAHRESIHPDLVMTDHPTCGDSGYMGVTRGHGLALAYSEELS